MVQAHGLRNIHLYEGDEPWINIRDAVGDLADKFLCLNDVYPDGFMIPKRFIGENILHLPTVKTHVFTTTTGAMKNAFGGLLNEKRHWTHPVIHETLVDLLMIQKKIHRGVFAVMDGTFAGDGPGPRCMVPHVKNVMLASADQVAIDAVAAKLMGMDPMSIKYIRLAHDLGLGCGDPRDIEIVGDVEAAKENWHFDGPVQEDDLRLADAAPDLLGAAAQADRVVAQDRAGAVGLHRERDLSRQFLVSPERRAQDRAGARQPVGTVVRELGAPDPGRERFPECRRNVGRDPARRHARVQTVSGHPRHVHQGSAGVCQPPSAHQSRVHGAKVTRMSEFTIRSESVDVEQIMKQIRQRILEKRGADYTEDQIRELATVRLEKFLDPKNLRSDLLEQFRKSRPAFAADTHPSKTQPPYTFDDQTLFASHRGFCDLRASC